MGDFIDRIILLKCQIKTTLDNLKNNDNDKDILIKQTIEELENMKHIIYELIGTNNIKPLTHEQNDIEPLTCKKNIKSLTSEQRDYYHNIDLAILSNDDIPNKSSYDNGFTIGNGCGDDGSGPGLSQNEYCNGYAINYKLNNDNGYGFRISQKF
jgi:hypothetical protein